MKLWSSFAIINECLMNVYIVYIIVVSLPCVQTEAYHDLLMSLVIRTSSSLIEQHWKDPKDFAFAMRHCECENSSLPKLLSDILPK